MAGIYDITLASGASGNIGALGSVFKVVSAPDGPVSIKIDGNDALILQEGQGMRLGNDAQGRPLTFRDLTVRNLATALQTIQVFIGPAGFEDSTIKGTVAVIDRGRSSTATGRRYLAEAYKAAFAGVGCAGFYMAAGSTRAAAISQVIINSNVAGNLNLFRAGNANPTVNYQSALAWFNKLIGGASAALDTWTSEAAASPPTGVEVPGYTYAFGITVAANSIQVFDFRDAPLILMPGQRFGIQSSVTNRDIRIQAQVEEFNV
jgi:hypothetical protein